MRRPKIRSRCQGDVTARGADSAAARELLRHYADRVRLRASAQRREPARNWWKTVISRRCAAECRAGLQTDRPARTLNSECRDGPYPQSDAVRRQRAPDPQPGGSSDPSGGIKMHDKQSGGLPEHGLHLSEFNTILSRTVEGLPSRNALRQTRRSRSRATACEYARRYVDRSTGPSSPTATGRRQAPCDARGVTTSGRRQPAAPFSQNVPAISRAQYPPT